ncbi:MAG: tRNA pseudouridine(38-40) synthase TruA [Gammaproteobacteria bacterium]
MTEPGPGLRRVAIGVEYDGTPYNGWQMQPHAPSIQDTLNDALSQVANETVSCVGAGRTDTGVHAAGQVAHFDTAAERTPRSWLLGLNSNLPSDISVQWAIAVSDDFHARYRATSRVYRYRILNQQARSALEHNRAWWVRQPLNVSAMRAAAGYFIGKHDFSAFRAAACQSKSPVRTLTRMELSQQGAMLCFEIEANAFLHHMVRNMLGTLVRVGRGEAEPVWVRDLLATRDRKLSGMTAPAAGLTLMAVRYPAIFGLPDDQVT